MKYKSKKYDNKYIELLDLYKIHLMPSKMMLFPNTDKKEIEFYETNATIVGKRYMNIFNDLIGGKTPKELENKYGEYLYKVLDDMFYRELIKFRDTPVNNNIRITGSTKVFYPTHISIELTDKCNLSCKHCYREANFTGRFIDYNNICNFIEYLTKYGLDMVEITGGEPTLHPRFVDIIDFMCKNLSLVAILTNGFMINDSILDVLRKYKDKIIISVSLDSYDKSFHDEFRGKIGAWENTVEALKKFIDIGILTRVAMSVVPENMFDVEETIKFIEHLGVNSFAWEISNTNGRGKNISWNDVDRETYLKYVKQTKYLQKKYHYLLNFLSPNSNRRMQLGDENCGAGWRTIAINPYGELKACVNENQKLFCLGNIDDLNVFEKNNDLLELLSEIETPSFKFCKNCDFFQYCQGCFIKGIQGAYYKKNQCLWPGSRVLKYINEAHCKFDNVFDCVNKRSLKV